MAEVVYFLCMLTSLACAVLLMRGYSRSRSRLLFWSAMCFVGLTLNNAILVVDLVFVRHVDLSTWRLVPAAVGFAALLYGLVWESE